MSTHVAVLGAGFAGLTAARRLGNHADTDDLRLTIVDRHNYHTFQPLLYQVATAGLQPQDIGHSVRAVFGLRGRRRPVDFRLGTVTDIDVDARRLRFADGDGLGYDQLVVAAGADTADYGIDGVEQHAFPLKSLGQSMRLRNHLLRCFEAAEAEPALIDDGLLTFVVAGGGPTGVELSGAIAELIDGPLRRDHPRLNVGRARILLVEMTDALLPAYHRGSQRYVREKLERRGVEVRLNTAIEKVTDHSVVFDTGEVLATETVVWTAGVRASSLADTLGVEQTAGGRVVVRPDLSVPGVGGLWVVGDMAGARDPDGQLYPQLAPVAIQQGRHVARQLRARLAGRPTRRFTYVDKGKMATVGRSDAVTELPFGLRFRGLPAWLAWLFLHLLYLVGFRNRVAVFLSWLWNYLTYDRSARLILDDDGDAPEAAGLLDGGG